MVALGNFKRLKSIGSNKRINNNIRIGNNINCYIGYSNGLTSVGDLLGGDFKRLNKGLKLFGYDNKKDNIFIINEVRGLKK